MARIRQIDIKNFRSIKAFTWLPSPGINCLIGPGDSGKSSILDAIDSALAHGETFNLPMRIFIGWILKCPSAFR
jgi:putative ATP-dependent endonuclease of the OLD family